MPAQHQSRCQPYQRLALTLIVSLILLWPGMPAAHAETASPSPKDVAIQHYQRKYISFFYPQDFPLNQALANAFSRDFPRFDYHLASTSAQMSLQEFLALTQTYQEQMAGQLAANQEIRDPRFGDKAITWSETQKIAHAAYVFVPHWTFSEIDIDGPYPSDAKKPGQDWYLNATTQVSLQLSILSLQEQKTQDDKTVRSSWNVSRDKVLRLRSSDIRAAAEQVGDKKHPIDLSKSLSSSDRSKILRALRKVHRIDSSIRQIEAQDPYVYMMDSAVHSMSYGWVIGDVRRLPAFLIRAEVAAADMDQDQVDVVLSEGENSQTLGIKMDASYKIVENLTDGNKPREIGWLKVRQWQEAHLLSQAIIVKRDFELGDQVVEYPKSGIGLNLWGSGLLTPIPKQGLGRPSTSQAGSLGTGLGLGLDLDADLGPWLGLSEFYLSVSGGALSLLGHTDDGFQAYNGFLLELGLEKKWYWRQLILALSLRGGGWTLGDDQASLGLAGLIGLHWQSSPDFGYGVNLGWRQYTLFSGPVLESFVRCEF